MYLYVQIIFKFGVFQTTDLHFLLENSLTAFEAMLESGILYDNRPLRP